MTCSLKTVAEYVLHLHSKSENENELHEIHQTAPNLSVAWTRDEWFNGL